jgi:hypothetical protein
MSDYDKVNAVWPKVVPDMTPEEGVSAGKRLYRHLMGKPFVGKVQATSGNRHTWIRWSRKDHCWVMKVNAKGGWESMAHNLSHWCHHKLYPGDRPHCGRHRGVEREAIEYVIRMGWLEGKLKPKPKAEKPKADPKVAKLASVEKRLKAWETKHKRAETALRKLRLQQKRLAK